jgi:hypothetical protein
MPRPKRDEGYTANENPQTPQHYQNTEPVIVAITAAIQTNIATDIAATIFMFVLRRLIWFLRGVWW